MNSEFTRELLLLVDAVADGLLSFDLTEVTQIYLPDVNQRTLDIHIDQITESGLIYMQRDRVIGLTAAGREYLS